MEPTLTPIGKDDRFCFDCHKGVPCFNACCRDLNQSLTPYDILRLKRHLKLTSDDFLARYTRQHIGPETGLPIITLRCDATRDNGCPFVASEGCRVYHARPSSCRIYPIARAIGRDRRTGRITEHFALLKEPHCRGFEQNKPRTVRQWSKDQGFEPYCRYNDMLMEIISLKNQFHPSPLDLRQQRLFYLALYDIDAFREHLFNKGLAAESDLDEKTRATLKKDDEALLVFGHRWVKAKLFDEMISQQSGRQHSKQDQG